VGVLLSRRDKKLRERCCGGCARAPGQKLNKSDLLPDDPASASEKWWTEGCQTGPAARPGGVCRAPGSGAPGTRAGSGRRGRGAVGWLEAGRARVRLPGRLLGLRGRPDWRWRTRQQADRCPPHTAGRRQGRRRARQRRASAKGRERRRRPSSMAPCLLPFPQAPPGPCWPAAGSVPGLARPRSRSRNCPGFLGRRRRRGRRARQSETAQVNSLALENWAALVPG